jgi:hypothetical protein
MSTTHAWFSASAALVEGSAVFRKLSGSTVNVTRTNNERQSKGPHRWEETYVGEVVRAEDGGCVHPRSRVQSITPDWEFPLAPDTTPLVAPQEDWTYSRRTDDSPVTTASTEKPGEAVRSLHLTDEPAHATQSAGQIAIERWYDYGGPSNDSPVASPGKFSRKPEWSVLSLEDLNDAVRRERSADDPARLEMESARVERAKIRAVDARDAKVAAALRGTRPLQERLGAHVARAMI